jgi:hypothetical protein
MNNYFFLFFDKLQNQGEEEIGHQGNLRKQQETKILEGNNLINGAEFRYQMNRTS